MTSASFFPSDDGTLVVTTIDGQRVEGRLEYPPRGVSLGQPGQAIFWFNRDPRSHGLVDWIYVSPRDVEPSWRRPA